MKLSVQAKLIVYSIILILVSTIFSTTGAALLNGSQTRAENRNKLENAVNSFQIDFTQMITVVEERLAAFTEDAERTSRIMSAIMFDPSTQDLPLEFGDLFRELNVEQAAFHFKDQGRGPEQLRYYYSRSLNGVGMVNYDEGEINHVLLVKDDAGFATEEDIKDPQLFPLVYKPSNSELILQQVDDQLLLIIHAKYINKSYEDPSIDLKKGQYIGSLIIQMRIDASIEELGRRMAVNFNLYDIEGKMGAGTVPLPNLNPDDILPPEEQPPEAVEDLVVELTDVQGEHYDAVVVPLQYQKHLPGYLSAAISQQATLNKISETVGVLVLIALCILVATLFASFFILRRFTQPIANLSDLFATIAEGSGDLTMKLPITSNDEIGKVAKSFNQFNDKIAYLVRQQRTIASKLSQVSEDQSKGSEALAGASEAVVESSHSETETMRGVETLTSELSKQSEEITKNTEDMTGLVTVTTNVVTEGNAAAQEMETSMEQISKNSKEISNALLTIQAIAKKTNLLSLNAAIEAAKAGVHGRGFTVVAQHVRELAKNARDAAVEIKALVETNHHNVEEGLDCSKKVNASYQAVKSNIMQIQNAFHMIKDISSQQNQKTGDIAKSMEELTDTNIEIESALVKVNEQSSVQQNLSTKLHDLAEQLLAQVKEYKIDR